MKPTIRIDASSLVYSACIRRFYWTVVDGYREDDHGFENTAMHLGSAYHIFAEHFYKDRSEELAMLAGRKYFLSKRFKPGPKQQFIDLPYFMSMCAQGALYLSNSPFQPVTVGDQPLVEIKFEIPVHEDDHCRICLCGTIDKVGKFKNGPYAIGDYKVSNASDPQKYFEQHKLSTQLLTYLWALRWFSREKEAIAEIWNGGQVGIFIDGVFHHGKIGMVDFLRSDVIYVPEKLIDAYECQLHTVARGLAFAMKHRDKVEPPPEGIINGSCSSYSSQCKFVGVCGATEPEIGKLCLEQNFVKKEYNPLEFR